MGTTGSKKGGVLEFFRRMTGRQDEMEEALLEATPPQIPPLEETDALMELTRPQTLTPFLSSSLSSTLTPETYTDLVAAFDNNPYSALSEVISHSLKSGSTFHGQTVNFKTRLNRAMDILDYFKVNEKDKKVLDDFYAIKQFLAYLYALANNKCRVNENELNKKLAALESALKKSGNMSEEDIKIFRGTLRLVTGGNTYADGRIKWMDRSGDDALDGRSFWQPKSFGSTEVDTSKSKTDLVGFTKALKVEHKEIEDGTKTVSAHFSYPRIAVLTKDRNKNVAIGARQQLFAQAADLATILVEGYERGTTPQNPLLIQYNGVNQPEAALALIMKYKEMAIEAGREFYAVYDKKNVAGQVERVAVVITPSKTLSPNEQDYFLKYAQDDKAFVNKGHSAELDFGGAGVMISLPGSFKYRKIEENIGSKLLELDQSDPQKAEHTKILDALEKHFDPATKENKTKKEDKTKAWLEQTVPEIVKTQTALNTLKLSSKPSNS